ncbi:putative LPS biosynthesis related glycosyltransferase [Pedobacter sp. BAL39]|uniref:glycosyltransferase family 2 protein n=1 Tax=Pedobacter sp. BAL39 TaxID=391596 RepID=UPI00015596F1|nr:glycosyltransferase family 2 protein [Pedobacter sp. BAL39]EDM37558.1 putative LPS biosynthesis related glycosyltransferase [Pedobacter sp. BAL39]
MKHAVEEGNDNILLSIIIATYNAERYIREGLLAVSNNIQAAYEIIIVDGNSQDNTVKIINQLHLDHCHLTSEPDKGIYDAMNKGIMSAKGKWILFLGADDRLLPSFNEILPELQDQHSIYYGNCRNGEHQLGGAFSQARLAKMNLCHQAILYPRQVFEKYKFNLKYPVFADYLLNMQCWGDKAIHKIYVPVDIAYYDMEGYSSTARDPDFIRDKPFFVKKHLGLFIYIKYRFRKFKESRKPGSKFF